MIFYFSKSSLPSVLWRCWLGGIKVIWPVKNWVVRYWRGYLSGARCKWFAYGPADATATPIISCCSKIQNGLPFWCQLTQVVLEKRLLNGCSSSSSSSNSSSSSSSSKYVESHLCLYCTQGSLNANTDKGRTGLRNLGNTVRMHTFFVSKNMITSGIVYRVVMELHNKKVYTTWVFTDF